MQKVRKCTSFKYLSLQHFFAYNKLSLDTQTISVTLMGLEKDEGLVLGGAPLFTIEGVVADAVTLVNLETKRRKLTYFV